MKKLQIATRINGDSVEFLCEPQQTLLEVLRDELQLSGTKEGCGTGDCGACTVTLEGRLVCSCLVLAAEVEGCSIGTIEGLATNGDLHPIQEAFWDNHGLQCGFCTAGMIMTAVEMIQRNPHPTSDEVRAGLEGNLCRCTGYQNIVKSILAAAEKMGG